MSSDGNAKHYRFKKLNGKNDIQDLIFWFRGAGHTKWDKMCQKIDNLQTMHTWCRLKVIDEKMSSTLVQKFIHKKVKNNVEQNRT